MRRSESGERGAAVVEFALVLPILVLLVFGIIDFGQGFNAQVELRGAVREGARALALGACASSSTTNSTCSSPPYAETVVQNAASNYNLSGHFSSETMCSPGDGAKGINATITVNYPLTYYVSLFGAGKTITSTGVIRCET
jgi:Flp pilus assembly protein TadG